MRTLPVVNAEGEVRAGRRMDFGLACDHRVVDGARAARFLAELIHVLEDPAQLMTRDDKYED